ncbi:hypothetical protein BUALT_Bualt03G0163700 [Buddleja alternifolia]|uniref:Transposase-associated domain-containing protein n=1 Tax=Buddleja alternifolia TaxID=168488 RepID=A0AAV6XU91_9LAMI|nr:hypothetical protein BUALT_Bualt03G0163700 [Buddleja alternifolia]
MPPDRSWIKNRVCPGGYGVTDEYRMGVKEFIELCHQYPRYMDRGKIRCPCWDCKSLKFILADLVSFHLISRGFERGYINWVKQGEPIWDRTPTQAPTNLMSEPMVFEPTISQENHDQFTEMVMDAAGPAFDWNSRDEPETPNPTAQKIFKMKDAADSPLWSGCEGYSELSALSELLNIKSESNLSERHYNRFLKAFGRMLPKGHKLPDSFYSSKKVVAPLGLGVEKIDACENDCMLYWKNEKELQQCKICHHPRFKLKTLWNDGVETYDVSKKQNFQMRASLMWTVSDFPAYGMLSGWSTHGKLSCPYCMSGIKSFRLKHGRKPCFFDCHRQFLPLNHPYRYQKDNFTKGRIEIDPPFIRLTGEELEAVVASLPTIEFGKTKDKERIEGFGETHNWLKRSIFWDLPYWNTNLIRHNLDVMHIEKNMFDNVFNTVMDVKGKSKDNLNARLDLQSICKRWDLELKEVNEKYLKPKASYTLSKDQRQIVLKWIKNLRLPDGYVSNLARCVNLDDCSLHGMKSHDCHVFIQRLLPLAFRDLLPESVWNGLTELSQFFRD